MCNHFTIISWRKVSIVQTGFLVGLVFTFVFWKPTEYFSVTDTRMWGLRHTVGTALMPPCSVSCINVVSAMGPCCQFVKSNYFLGNISGCLGTSMRTFFSNNSIIFNPINLVTRNDQLGLIALFFDTFI